MQYIENKKKTYEKPTDEGKNRTKETSTISNNDQNDNNINAIFNGWVTKKNHTFDIQLFSCVDGYELTSQCILKIAKN